MTITKTWRRTPCFQLSGNKKIVKKCFDIERQQVVLSVPERHYLRKPVILELLKNDFSSENYIQDTRFGQTRYTQILQISAESSEVKYGLISTNSSVNKNDRTNTAGIEFTEGEAYKGKGEFSEIVSSVYIERERRNLREET